MTLHDLHLASLGDGARPMEPAMALALQANFGSVERWRADFVAMAGTRSSPGALLLAFEPGSGQLVNEWASSPARPDSVPVLVFETAQGSAPPASSGIDEPEAEAFVDAIDWAGVYLRYQHAVHEASEGFGAGREDVAAAMLIDVRRAGVFAKAQTCLPDSRWLDPAEVGQWLHILPKDRAIIVSCIYGHEVGRATALRLRAAGLQARYLRGGIDGWQSAGLPLVAK